MASQHFLGGLFPYLRLQIFVFVFRLLLRWRTAAHIRRDNAILPLSEAGVRKQRIQLPSREPGRFIVADLYLPSSHDGKDALGKTPLPVLVNWHGSGFVFPLHGTDAYFCIRMARDAGIAVLDADYRKAPEHPYPAAIDDAEDALRWVASSPAARAAYNLDSGRVAVSGFSAGGHIAAVAASYLKQKLESEAEGDLGGLKIQMLLSVYGSSDIATDATTKKPPSPSLRAHAPWILNMFADAYAPDPSTRTDPAVSPGFADPDAFPQTTAFLTCEGDNLRWEIETLVERLKEKGAVSKGLKERRGMSITKCSRGCAMRLIRASRRTGVAPSPGPGARRLMRGRRRCSKIRFARSSDAVASLGAFALQT
ncbi:alpha/beta-hydrolase [Apiospora rasikravindrae]|uniref:Alpha/beta-hydrolase n=1 Tax=Apiospora rasikravindrae TaxID=990691 RepID=A0ABR1U086_9PEZI